MLNEHQHSPEKTMMAEASKRRKTCITARRSAVFAFLIVVIIFGVLNIWTFASVPECCDAVDTVGFPFRFFESGGFRGDIVFYPLALAQNAVVILAIASVSAWISYRALRRN